MAKMNIDSTTGAKIQNKSGYKLEANVVRDTPSPKKIEGKDLRTRRSGKYATEKKKIRWQ